MTETGQQAPRVRAARPVDDGFGWCEPVDPGTRELVTSPDRDVVFDQWSADARMCRYAAELYVAVAAMAARRPATDDLPAGAPGAAGVDSRALAAPGLASVSEAFIPELAVLRGCTEAEAATLAWEAVTLVHHLPETLQALAEGRCDQRKTRVLVDLLAPASREVAERVQAVVLPEAATGTAPQLRERVRRLLVRWEADALAARRAERRRQADARARPVGDGMSEFIVDLDSPTAAACADACDRYARLLRAGGDRRPIGVLRASVAAQLILRPWDTRRPPVTASLTVHASLASLVPEATQPAEVSGDVVSAAQCRQLLARLDALGVQAPPGGSLQIAVEDATGRLVATGTRRELTRAARRGRGLRPPAPTGAYRPTGEQRRFVTTRDRTCRMPGCRRRAERCDVDHDTPWHNGGATATCNLVTLCRHHHRLKTHARGWSFQLHPDGRLTVRTPSGVVRTSRPPGVTTDEPPGSHPGIRTSPAADDPPPF